MHFRRVAALICLAAAIVFSILAEAQLSDGFSIYDRQMPSLESRYDQAIALSEAGDYAGVALALRPLASEGYADAQYQLAVLHFEGKDKSMTDAEAVAWTRKAAQQDHWDAQELLIILPISGYHKLVSHSEAHIYHEKLAHKGRAGSQHHMGLRAAESGDYETAREWWEKAAKQGYDLALDRLASLPLSEPPVSVQPSRGSDIEKGAFPVYADTDLSDIGDAALSCVFAMSGNIDIEDPPIDLVMLTTFYIDPKYNGGLSAAQLEHQMSRQIMAKATSSAGPTRQYCEDNIFGYIEKLVSEGP